MIIVMRDDSEVDTPKPSYTPKQEAKVSPLNEYVELFISYGLVNKFCSHYNNVLKTCEYLLQCVKYSVERNGIVYCLRKTDEIDTFVVCEPSTGEIAYEVSFVVASDLRRLGILIESNEVVFGYTEPREPIIVKFTKDMKLRVPTFCPAYHHLTVLRLAPDVLSELDELLTISHCFDFIGKDVGAMMCVHNFWLPYLEARPHLKAQPHEPT